MGTFNNIQRSRRIPLLIILLLTHRSFLYPASTATTANYHPDAAALLELRSHIINTTASSNALLLDWTTEGGGDVCSDWVGVSCGRRHNRATSLNLANMGLQGTLPHHLGNLSFLVSLDLSGNLFHGNLPMELSKLRRLKILKLSNNLFEGGIPYEIGSMRKLEIASFARNHFTGSIPVTLGNCTMLKELYLGFTNFTGEIPYEIGNLRKLEVFSLPNIGLSGIIPPNVFNVSTIQVVDVSGNKLAGEVPYNLCDHASNLKVLALQGNQLNGPLPFRIGDCKNLQFAHFSYNHFTGNIPITIGNCSMLKELDLGSNNLTGTIPVTLGNCSMLKQLVLEATNLTGEIPSELGGLKALEILNLGRNKLSGLIPWTIFNMSFMKAIDLYDNELSGTLASNFGSQRPVLEWLNVWGNRLNGSIPSSISNASMLTLLGLQNNLFSGRVPNSIGNLQRLEHLRIWQNHNLVIDPSFFTSLTRCEHLISLEISCTSFAGALPASIGSFPPSLQSFTASDCKIYGTIPDELGDLRNIIEIDLSSNRLTGSIPRGVKRLKKLQKLLLHGNELNGAMPSELCQLQALYQLNLGRNNISQRIPDCLPDLTSLKELYLEFNSLSNGIPSSFWQLTSLVQLNLAGNSLSGTLPREVSNLKVLYSMNVSWNQLSGDIPSAIGDLTNLQSLSIARNHFQGSIPESLSHLINIEFLDLSANNLSGVIPQSMELLRYLKYFNASLNGLWGEIPSAGPFENLSAGSFLNNIKLCGLSKFGVPSCHETKHFPHKYVVLLILVATIIVLLVIATIVAVFANWRGKKSNHNVKGKEESLPPTTTTWKRISLLELQRATNGFDDCNLLGKGSFGRVYKGELVDGANVAVKVFDLEREESGTFVAECEVLGNLRHRNLIKIVSLCCTTNFKGLVLELMPNGSLDKWLYSHNYFLDIFQRLNIVIDVASALEYLHHGYSTPIVHCDLKPSNVLLDKDLVAHVSDFGTTRFLGGDCSITQTMALATIGYMAPEFGREGIVSRKSDVYSFGILLMEVFTRRKPTEEFFHEEMDMIQWVRMSLSTGVINVADTNLLICEKEKDVNPKTNCLSSIMKVAIECCAETPRDRMDIHIVLYKLETIRSRILKDLVVT